MKCIDQKLQMLNYSFVFLERDGQGLFLLRALKFVKLEESTAP